MGLAVVVSLAFFSPVIAADDVHVEQVAELRRIKQRIIAEMTFGDLPADSSARLENVRRLDAMADALLAMRPHYWSQYDTVGHPAISHHGRAYQDVLTLATAYATAGSKHHRHKAVLAAVERGMRHLSQFAHPDCPQPHNWWAWQIGIPKLLTPTLILLQHDLDPELYRKQLQTVTYLLKSQKEVTQTGPYRPSKKRFVGKTDTNALWRARLRMQLAVLIENPAMAGKWSERTFGQATPAGKGHLQADYSFKFHGAIPMWAYGRRFLTDYAMLVGRYAGTRFGPTSDELDNVARMAEHYVNGFVYRGRICPAIIGRELTRGDDRYVCSAGLVALASLARAKHPRADLFAAIVARERKHYAHIPAHASFVAAAAYDLPNVPPAPPVRDILVYPDSDFLQITRPDWAVGIKMHSKWNRGYESINQENLKGWFLSHGSMFHFIADDAWRGCWPTLDWTRLPGTTVDASVTQQNRSPLVGVLRSSAEVASAAMEIRSDGFAARKSWLVNGDHIVCVGSGISGPKGAETTILNLPVTGDATLLIDGSAAPAGAFEKRMRVEWLWLQGMGYVLPEGCDVLVLRESRTDSWSSVRGEKLWGRSAPVTRRYVTAVIVHGPGATSYRYIVAPNVTRDRMPDVARRLRAKYDIQNQGHHRIATRDEALTSLVMWEPGRVDPFEADRGCMILKTAGKTLVVDPTQTNKPLTLTVAGKRSTISPVNGRPVTLN